MDQEEHSATLRVDEAHAIVGRDKISRNAFYAAVRRGDIPSFRWGRRLLIPRKKFEKLLSTGGLVERDD